MEGNLEDPKNIFNRFSKKSSKKRTPKKELYYNDFLTVATPTILNSPCTRPKIKDLSIPPSNNLHKLMLKKLIPNNRTALNRFAPDIVRDSARRSHGFDHPPSGRRVEGGWRPGVPNG